jgi:hypothetical protein
MLPLFRAKLDGLKPEIGKSTEIDKIHLRAPAHFLVSWHKRASPAVGKSPARPLGDIRANHYVVTDIPVSFGVFVGYRPRPYDSDSQ